MLLCCLCVLISCSPLGCSLFYREGKYFHFLFFSPFSSNPNENFFVVVVIFLLKARELTWFCPSWIHVVKKMQRVLTKHAKCFINQSTKVEMKPYVFKSAWASRYAGRSVKPLTKHNIRRQMSSHCVMREGHDRWLPTTKRGHRDKISVVLITSVCNVIYP